MVYAHELTNTLMYAGPVTDMVAAISDLPAGGQVGLHETSSRGLPLNVEHACLPHASGVAQPSNTRRVQLF